MSVILSPQFLGVGSSGVATVEQVEQSAPGARILRAQNEQWRNKNLYNFFSIRWTFSKLGTYNTFIFVSDQSRLF
jgi:hypothetical protein